MEKNSESFFLKCKQQKNCKIFEKKGLLIMNNFLKKILIILIFNTQTIPTSNLFEIFKVQYFYKRIQFFWKH